VIAGRLGERSSVATLPRQVLYFRVEDHACRVVNFKEEPPDTAKIICDVRDTCAKEFKEDGCCGALPANVSLEGLIDEAAG
jgi:hypothetical protein